MKRRSINRLRCGLVVLALSLPACCSPARGQVASFPHGTIELLAETQSIAPGRDFALGLHFRLESGWHIYWVNPGDSGEPPRVTWQLPPGITTEAVQWPFPRRLGSSSLADYGYIGGILLIVPTLAAADLSVQQPVKIGARVNLLVCRDVCIPGEAQVSVALPVSPRAPAPSSTQVLFARARRSLPQAAPKNWRFTAKEEKDSFVLAAHLGFTAAHAQFFPLEGGQIDNVAPQIFAPIPGGFRLELRKSDQLTKAVSRLKGVLVLSAGRAYQIDAPVRGAAADSQGGSLGNSVR